MPLVIAIAVLLIGVGVVVVIAFWGNGPDAAITTTSAVVTPGSDTQATNPVLPPTPAPTTDDVKNEQPTPAEGSGSDTTPPAPGDDMISVHVVSDPAGADVLLNAKVIGSTPLDMKMKKGVGTSTLVVHKLHYKDEVSKLDLSGDFQKNVTLRKLVEEKATHRDPPHRDPPPVHHEPPHETAHVAAPKEPPPPTVTAPPKVPDCQPPGQMDPFDKRPPCKT